MTSFYHWILNFNEATYKFWEKLILTTRTPKLSELSLLVARVNFKSWVKFESWVRLEPGSNFCFFFDYTNDVRTVNRNINFPVGDIFHSRSKEPLLLHIAVASPRYKTTINTFSKNIKASNLHIAEEHVPFTWYTRKTDRSRSQSHLVASIGNRR